MKKMLIATMLVGGAAGITFISMGNLAVTPNPGAVFRPLAPESTSRSILPMPAQAIVDSPKSAPVMMERPGSKTNTQSDFSPTRIAALLDQSARIKTAAPIGGPPDAAQLPNDGRAEIAQLSNSEMLEREAAAVKAVEERLKWEKTEEGQAAARQAMREREAATRDRLSAQYSGPKRDILGIYPGMTRAEADAVWKNNGWICVSTKIPLVRGWGTEWVPSETSFSCPTSAGKIVWDWGKTTNIVHRVQLEFKAGGGIAEVANSVNGQFNATLKREENDLSRALGVVFRYRASLNNGIELSLKGVEDFVLTIESPRALANEEDATRKNDFKQQPAPRF